MKIKMKQTITGRRNGDRWPAVGETLEVSTAEGEALVGQGYAEEVKGSTKSEKATSPPKGEKRASTKKSS